MSADLPDPPQLDHERYAVGTLLGSGGAAEVWSVWDADLAVHRAVKILTVAGSQRATLRRRLRAEARVLASIDHPHVLRVLEMGTTRDGRDYLVMDLVAGGSLADRVRREGPLPPAEAVTRMLEVLSALAAAHGRGIVHRDVKPQNVLLAADGRAVLADFGIALVAEGDRRTRTGVAMGSFAFMPPEQRLDAKHVGPRADLYAVGATLYWTLTGRSPIDLFVEGRDGPRLSVLPEGLADAIAWATRAEPADRPADAAALAARLRALAPAPIRDRRDLDPALFPAPADPTTFTGGAELPTTVAREDRPTQVPATPAPVPSRGPPPETPSPVPVLVLAAAVLLVLVGTGGLVLLLLPGPEPVIVDEVPLEIPLPLSPDEVIPAPPLEPPRRAAPTPPPAPVTGSWAGSFDGRPATLTLDGPPASVSGTFQVRFGANAVDSRVRGRWAEGRRTLVLEDVADTPDAGRYEARRVGARLEGTFRGRYRDVVLPFTLTRRAR